MANPNSDPLSFEGTDPKECETFITTIRRRAFDQGRHRDNEWMAGLASTCFAGDAFYWYEELDEDVKNDWSRLRSALVARFGRGSSASATTSGISSTPGSAPSAVIPTPAAAPPSVAPRLSVRKGHLKVLNSAGGCLGYIQKSPSKHGFYRSLVTLPNNALLVSFTVSSVSEPFEIQVSDSSQPLQDCDWLAVIWFGLAENNWVNLPGIYATSCSFSVMASKNNGEIKRKVWKISEDGEVIVEYPNPNGGTKRLYAGYKDGDTRWLQSPEYYSVQVCERIRIFLEDVV